MKLRPTALLFVIVVIVSCAGSVQAQGRADYFNVESPQVHPIDIARIGGHDYLLVCNTPDNSLEIWDTDETIPIESRMIARLPVDLEPVSVLWVPELERALVANFLGDSISSIALVPDDGNVPIRAVMIGTYQVTDEPLAMAFSFVNLGGLNEVPVLFVTHMTLDAVGKYNAVTLEPILPGSERIDAAVSAGADIDFDLMIDDIALKEPRTAAIACDKLFVLGHKGGNTIRYDFDLYTEDLLTGAVSALGGLGSTNGNMAFAGNGDLFVVGGIALNQLRDEATVAAAPTGFVKSMFWMVEDACSGNPTIHARDVNLKKLIVQQQLPRMLGGFGGQAQPAPEPQLLTGPVGKGKSLSQLTAVLPFEQNGSVSKVFFTAMGNDRLGIIEPDASVAPIDWPIRRINIGSLSSPVSGPRALALKGAGGGAGDPGARLYVLNRFDNSVTVIDPVSELVQETFELASDPTPAHIVAGREFLYSAKLSGNGKVACASCHVDGRSDGLAWDLGDNQPQAIRRELMPGPNFSGGMYRPDKDFMVTQTLQGLLNWEVPPENQRLFTNAPYHWRGDREDFLAFNGAFESLLDGAQLDPTDMARFEEFVNSIHFPPNPKQPSSRILSGELGDPDDNDANQDISGDGALLGLKIYHIANADGRSCAGCHTLPDGSDNVLTEVFSGVNPHPVPSPPMQLAPNQAMETAALRFLFQKESRLDRDGSSDHKDSPITGYEGLLHTGLTTTNHSPDWNGTASMNAFNQNFFSTPRLCVGPDIFCHNLRGLNQFLHEMDTGSGPMIGRSHTVTAANRGSSATTTAFKETERQAEVANAGLVAHLWSATDVRGFWYDQTVDPPVYREEPGTLALKRTQLLDLIVDERDRLTLMAVPLGSERRLAHRDGVPEVQQGPAPAGVSLQSMTPNTAYTEIPRLSLFWDNGQITFGGTHAHSVRVYQNALLDDAPGGFGLCSIRHEAPRRFRVTGKQIRHGAELHLFIQNDPLKGPPDLNLGPEDQAQGQVETLRIVLPIHPTAREAFQGGKIWETAVEMEPLLFYRLMAGRPDQGQLPNPPTMLNVTDLDFLRDVNPESQPGLFDPPSWNRHWVRIVNPDGAQFDAGWSQLLIEPGPDCP